MPKEYQIKILSGDMTIWGGKGNNPARLMAKAWKFMDEKITQKPKRSGRS